MTEPASVTGQPWEDIRIRVRDGLRLYGRHYPAPSSRRRPVLCLAGLTRNSRDFHDLALTLSGDGPEARPVFTLDTRGRGLSDYATSWRDYNVLVEMLDVQDFMAACQLHQAAVFGTSRGGLITMVMAAAQPSLLGAVVLNDIGPVIERDGLMRIAGYVTATSPPVSWAEAASRLERIGGQSFPDLGQRDWEKLARQLYNEEDGKPAPGYDPEIARSFSSVKDGNVPALWAQFEALKRVPCLTLRGERSDLLSEETTREMARRHPDCTVHVVSAQGHAPLLWDAPTQSAISAFLAASDAPA